MKEKITKATKQLTVIAAIFVLGMLSVRMWDFYAFMDRKWNAVKWVMTDYNEEIVEKHMSTQKAELQLVITKK